MLLSYCAVAIMDDDPAIRALRIGVLESRPLSWSWGALICMTILQMELLHYGSLVK